MGTGIYAGGGGGGGRICDGTASALLLVASCYGNCPKLQQGQHGSIAVTTANLL